MCVIIIRLLDTDRTIDAPKQLQRMLMHLHKCDLEVLGLKREQSYILGTAR